MNITACIMPKITNFVAKVLEVITFNSNKYPKLNIKNEPIKLNMIYIIITSEYFIVRPLASINIPNI